MIDNEKTIARPQEEDGPSYERDQGMKDLPVGGTYDAHSDLTLDSSGLEEDRHEADDSEEKQ